MLNGNTYNHIELKGFVGREPEIRFSSSGLKIATFTLGTTRNQSGERVVDWHRAVCFGKLADVVDNYITVGKQVFIIGSLKYSHFDSVKSNGETVSVKSPEIVVDSLFLMGTGSSSDQNKKQTTNKGNVSKDTTPDNKKEDLPEDIDELLSTLGL